MEIPPPAAPKVYDAAYDLSASPVARELRLSQRSARQRLILTVGAGLLILLLAAGIIFAGGAMLWYRDRVEPYAEGIAALANYAPAPSDRPHL